MVDTGELDGGANASAMLLKAVGFEPAAEMEAKTQDMAAEQLSVDLRKCAPTRSQKNKLG